MSCYVILHVLGYVITCRQVMLYSMSCHVTYVLLCYVTYHVPWYVI